MAEDTSIEWADHTFNPWEGCQAVSPGCDHCYAEARAKRFNSDTDLWSGGRRRTSEAYWKQPLKWNRQAPAFVAAHGRPPMVFCASLADVFDNQVPEQWRRDLWALIDATPDLIWLLLTKRPQNIRKMLPPNWAGPATCWQNVWLGTTVENQAEADRRIPHLLAVPAAKRFLSCEPLVGPVDLTAIRRAQAEGFMRPLDGRFNRIDWVIAGGESGREARPSHPDWFRSLRDQCAAAGVPYLFKQWGEYLPVGQVLPPYGRVHGATAVRPGRMKLHWGGSRTSPPKHVFAERGVEFSAHDDGGLTFRVGKKAAGRLLDGVIQNERPLAMPVSQPPVAGREKGRLI